MTDCATPRHAGDAESTAAGHGAYLCRACRSGLARDLRRLPGLHADLSRVLTTARPGTGGGGQGLPYNDTVAEARSQIVHDLTWWTRTTDDARRHTPPLPPTRPEVPAMAAWLHQLATPPRPWIPYQDFAPDLAGAISEDRARAVALLDPWIRKSFPIRGPDGRCPACAAGRLLVTVYASDGDRRRSFAACDTCGQRWEPEQWLRLGRIIIGRRQSVAI